MDSFPLFLISLLPTSPLSVFIFGPTPPTPLPSNHEFLFLSHSVLAYQWEEVMRDAQRRTLQSVPGRLSYAQILNGLNWKGMALGIWVCRLLMYLYMQVCVLVCVCMYGNTQKKDGKHTASSIMHSAKVECIEHHCFHYLFIYYFILFLYIGYASSCVNIYVNMFCRPQAIDCFIKQNEISIIT